MEANLARLTMSYSHLLFDFDHTLFDTDASEAHAFEYALVGAGIPDASAHLDPYQRINQSMWRQVELGELSPNDVKVRRFERLATEAQLDFDHEMVAEDYVVGLGRFGDLYPGALELVEDLSGQFSLTMITNGIGAVQRGRIERLGIDRFFEVTVISGEVGVSKPRREIFDIALDNLGDPDRASCVMIGDSLGSDVLGGINAGVHTCWFNPDRKPNTTTTRPGTEVADYAELRSLVGTAAG